MYKLFILLAFTLLISGNKELNDLKSKYLGKEVIVKQLEEDKRAIGYKNFFKDKKLKKLIKGRAKSGFKNTSDNGGLIGTIVLKSSESNWSLLSGKIFKVNDIKPFPNKYETENETKTFLFELKSDESIIYYRYNSKFGKIDILLNK